MLTVQLDSADIATMLSQARSVLSDLRPVMSAISRTLESNVHLRLDTKTDPSGHQWQPWSRSTAKARAKEGRGTLLEYTGRMRASLTFHADSDSVTIQFGVPYAATHEFGTSRTPARPLLFDHHKLSASDTLDVLAAAERAIARRLI